LGKIYTLNDERADKANRAILKLIAIAKCMEVFEDRELAGDMTNGFKYIIEDATSEITRSVFWEDSHG
jgi:hypothetical protein